MIQFIKYLISEVVLSTFFDTINKNFTSKKLSNVSNDYFDVMNIGDIYSEVVTFKNISNDNGTVKTKKVYFNVEIIDIKACSINIAYDYMIASYKINDNKDHKQLHGGITVIFKENIVSVKE